MQILEIKTPPYDITGEPDDQAIGRVVDAELRKQFTGKQVLVRAIASSEHPGKTVDELVAMIVQTGTDRYDPARAGDRYENIDNRHIDLFAFQADLSTEDAIFHQAVWGFYHSSKAIHGYPMRIDIVTVYDATKMNQVTHRYAGREDIKDDGFSFKDSDNKPDAILGIIKLL